ncbi:hypothetical protein [Pseudomonas benzenivorans]|uniref:Lipoprotein n=1 Tax=Pseudomonas benzenivorans TaxID=556533 RepID=A0ABY5H8X7_9PSED|nr:hypothetical protein [Pseudomonas benzenivorans]UTW08776.1 hypothetical protein KDW96_05530 [Pseudomonas benzenivorans]
MHRPNRFALAGLVLALAGCTTPPPAERPYSDAEIKQFSLELLSRSGLPYEDYERVRRALMKPERRMSNTIRDLDSLPPTDPRRG